MRQKQFADTESIISMYSSNKMVLLRICVETVNSSDTLKQSRITYK